MSNGSVAEQAQRTIEELFTSTWALAALTLAVERDLLERLDPPATASELARGSGLARETVGAALDTLVALGLLVRTGEDRYGCAEGLTALLEGGGGKVLRAVLRSTLTQYARVFVDARDPATQLETWSATDPVAVQAEALLSATMADRIVQHVVPTLDGLAERLAAPGAAVLDAGCGAAGLCIHICQAFPAARVVGLEPTSLPLKMARHNVSVAGLDERIELREQPLDALSDEETFDLAYVAQMCMPDEALERGLPQVARALRPGSWLLTAAVSSPADTLPGAVSRLHNAVWGGGARAADDVAARLRDAGFVQVEVRPPAGSAWLVVGRRL